MIVIGKPENPAWPWLIYELKDDSNLIGIKTNPIPREGNY